MLFSESKFTKQLGGTTVTESYSSINKGPFDFVFFKSLLFMMGVLKDLFFSK